MTEPTSHVPPSAWLPEGASIAVPQRSRLLVRDSQGPAGAPVLVLVHGWLATADLNFGFAYATLAEEFRVIAFDQRGHGRGTVGNAGFTFEGAADDIAAVLDSLRIERAIVVGYSMGGPIALTFAHRHADRIDGLVLCATAGTFSRSPIQRAALSACGPLVEAGRMLPDFGLRRTARRRFIARRATGEHRDWIADEIAPSSIIDLARAGLALGRFDAFRWISTLRTTTASVVTTRDELVPPARQRALAGCLDATVHEVDGGHTVCFDDPGRFNPVLLDACRSATRAATPGDAARRVGRPIRSESYG